MKSNSILIIEDDKEIVEIIDSFLTNDGYVVYKAYNGKDGLEILDNYTVDLIILDIMLPEMDGLEVCRRIRGISNIPIIMASAKSQDMDKIIGLGIGADDYVAKPFNPMELMARVKSQLRRYTVLNTANVEAENTIHVKGLAINQDNHSVSLYGDKINLTPTEYEILLLLAKNPGRVFSSEKILEMVWQEKYYQANNTVMVHIWRLREKIEDNPKEPKIIETVWGVGYKIES